MAGVGGARTGDTGGALRGRRGSRVRCGSRRKGSRMERVEGACRGWREKGAAGASLEPLSPCRLKVPKKLLKRGF